jgi:hypothetical protein
MKYGWTLILVLVSGCSFVSRDGPKIRNNVLVRGECQRAFVKEWGWPTKTFTENGFAQGFGEQWGAGGFALWSGRTCADEFVKFLALQPFFRGDCQSRGIRERSNGNFFESSVHRWSSERLLTHAILLLHGCRFVQLGVVFLKVHLTNRLAPPLRLNKFCESNGKIGVVGSTALTDSCTVDDNRCSAKRKARPGGWPGRNFYLRKAAFL